VKAVFVEKTLVPTFWGQDHPNRPSSQEGGCTNSRTLRHRHQRSWGRQIPECGQIHTLSNHLWTETSDGL